MLSLVDQLSAMGIKLEEKQVMALLLSSMPDSYNTVVMALESRPDDQLTLDIVKEKLLSAFSRRSEGASLNLDSETVLKINESKFRKNKKNFKRNVTSDICHKNEHFQSDCWFAKKQVGNKSKTVNLAMETESVSDSDSSNKNVCFKTSISTNKDVWYIDSGATSHMCNNRDFFDKLKKVDEQVTLAMVMK